jgi:Electron transfer DM13
VISLAANPARFRHWLGTTRGRLLVCVTGLFVMTVLGVGLYLFQPWALFTSTTVHEPAPVTVTDAAPPGAPQGQFVSLAHDTTGTAMVLRTVNGTNILRLAALSTSNGPDVRVWLSSRPVDRAQDSDKGGWLELGRLKGNKGDQNYTIPAGTDLTRYRSVVLWCKRFSVAFGAAPLATT